MGVKIGLWVFLVLSIYQALLLSAQWYLCERIKDIHPSNLTNIFVFHLSIFKQAFVYLFIIYGVNYTLYVTLVANENLPE